MNQSYEYGDIIARKYEVQWTASGGMGVVYVCKDIHSEGIRVVLKTIKDELLNHPLVVQNFINESRIWISLGYHDHIITAFGIEMVDKRPYLLLEYGGGWSLRSWMEENQLTYKNAVEISQKIASGMTYVQKKIPSLVHRDLKPDNILLKSWKGVRLDTQFMIDNMDKIRSVAGDDPDNPDFDALSRLSGKEVEHRILNVKVTDFGIAKATSDFDLENNVLESIASNKSHIAIRTGLAGTLKYMSPEQCKSETIDSRSDIYSFGIILYEMFAGNWPYTSKASASSILNAHIHQEPLPIQRANPKLRADLASLIMKCLEKDRASRYQSFDEILQPLTELEKELSEDPNVHNIYNMTIEPPSDLDILIHKGEALIEMGDVSQGLLVIENAISKTDDKVGIYCLAAEALRNIGQSKGNIEFLRKGLKYCELALSVDPDNLAALGEKGIILALTNRIHDAILVYDRILSLDPKNAQMHVNKGAILCDYLQRFQEALECFNCAIKLDPEIIQAWTNKGVVLGHLGCFDEALEAFEKALSLDPKSATVLLTMGAMLNDRLGRSAEALEKFERALQINSSLPEAWHSRGVALRDLERNEEALESFGRAFTLENRFTGSLANMGMIYMKRGDFSEAIKYFQTVLQIDPTDKEAYEAYLYCSNRLGKNH